jgi:hypothetical protein
MTFDGSQLTVGVQARERVLGLSAIRYPLSAS